MTVTEYKIIEATDAATLATDIAAQVLDGWEVSGQFIITIKSDDTMVYSQLTVKRGKGKKDGK